MATILVTGAAGFIGSHTVDLLLQEGHQVVGVDNFRTGKAANLTEARCNPRFRFESADILAPELLPSLVKDTGAEAIIHLAALVSVPESFAQPELNRRLNFEATQLVAETARSCPTVRRIVFASSAAVYGNNQNLPLTEDAPTAPLSPYGEAKLASEKLLSDLSRREPRVTTVSFRYFNVYGPRQDPTSAYSGVISRFADALREDRTPAIHGDGEQTRDFIAVADVARANVLAATRPGLAPATMNICTGRSTSLNTLLSRMTAEMNRGSQATHGPSRTGDIRHSLGSPALAAAVLGFSAAHDLRSGLRALLSPDCPH